MGACCCVPVRVAERRVVVTYSDAVNPHFVSVDAFYSGDMVAPPCSDPVLLRGRLISNEFDVSGTFRSDRNNENYLSEGSIKYFQTGISVKKISQKLDAHGRVVACGELFAVNTEGDRVKHNFDTGFGATYNARTESIDVYAVSSTDPLGFGNVHLFINKHYEVTACRFAGTQIIPLELSDPRVSSLIAFWQSQPQEFRSSPHLFFANR